MAALSSLVGQPLSGSPRVNFGQFRKPCFHNWRGITVSVPPTCTLATASPLSGSRRVNFGQFRKPSFHNWRGITVSVPPTCTLATASGNNAREQPTDHSINSLSDHDPEVVDVPEERDFTGTAYVPIYVKLPLGIINMECEIVDADGLLYQLKVLKSANVDGVMVQCWWGIVEAHIPREYNWTGYKRLFEIVRDLNLKLKVGLSFHECGGNIGDDVHIPLPRWVTEVGHKNPDIYFTDKDLRRNHECLTWGIDKEPVLRGRTALEVYFGLMKRFRSEFNEFFENGVISEIEVGLGPSGALRYPSHPAKFGWKYPGIGEFQCYDKYLAKSLEKAAETRGNILCGEGPWNAGSYNSEPQETKFFRDRGDYERSYGMFFLNWYSQVLIDHGDRVLRLANLAFRGTRIAAKLSGIYWWFGTMSHAAELTAGYYNIDGRSGYSAIASMLKKREAALNFTCFELCKFDEQNDFPEASVDPESLVWQVLLNAWAAKVPFAGENTRSCYHREGYNKILENAKPLDDPYGDAHISAFTYLGLSLDLLEKQNLMEFERFIQKMHGEFLPPIK